MEPRKRFPNAAHAASFARASTSPLDEERNRQLSLPKGQHMNQGLPGLQEFESRFLKESPQWDNVVLPRWQPGRSGPRKSVRREWTDEEGWQLLELVPQAEEPISWTRIAKLLPGRTAAQCRAHWFDRLDPRLQNLEPWSEHEDWLVLRGVRRFGFAWTKIARSLKGRPAAQIRARYQSTLQHDLSFFSSVE